MKQVPLATGVAPGLSRKTLALPPFDRLDAAIRMVSANQRSPRVGTTVAGAA
jgi:hypothetical protein